MKARIANFLKGSSTTFFVLGILQLALATGIQAWEDYGWLGVIIVVFLGIPTFPIVLLAGWFFMPFVSMVWIYVFLTLGVAFSWSSQKLSV